MYMFDVAIIGGGPGGYVAAIRAKQLGLSVALIEESSLGGVCLNWGCIPTKSLLKSSSLFQAAAHMSTFGVHVSEIRQEITTMVARSRNIAQKLAGGIDHLMKKNDVKCYKGRGRLLAKKGEVFEVQYVHENAMQTLQARHVILATGARARMLFDPALEVLSAKEAMVPQSIPQSLLVIGAGAIGIEFASFYQTLGTKVTVIEQGPHVLPSEDHEVSKAVAQEFQKQSMTILTQHQVAHLERRGGEGYTARILDLKTQKETLWEGERVLCAVGVVGNTENLGLEHFAVQTQHNHIVTDGYGQTTERGIYAIGDVAGAPWLAHKASHEGVICVERIAGLFPQALQKHLIPGCIYSLPQVASVGLSENAARTQGEREGFTLKVGKAAFMANGAALVQDATVGFVKTVFRHDTGELLGAHMVGQGVTEMIQGFVIAKTLEATQKDLERIIFPHPTLSEVMYESILSADQMALHG